MALFNVKEAQEQAAKEVKEEAIKKATGQIKGSLQKIEAAKQVLVNLEKEHEVLLRTIGE